MLPKYAGKPKTFEGKHSELSQKIIKVFFDVHNELGYGFSERVYQKAYAIALRQDGMKVDEKGNLYVTSGVVWVFDKAGKHLGNIAIPEPPANCAFGGKDNKTLFITARTSVYKVQIKIKGIIPIVAKE